MEDDDPENLFIALRHPMRRDILRLLMKNASSSVTPKELSKMLDKQLSSVSYHVRVLAKTKAIILESTEPIRGAVRHHYRPAPIVEQTPWVRETLGIEGGDDGDET